MKKDKYYTPTIEEFYVGFRCEFKNDMQDNKWKAETCDVDTVSLAYACIEDEDDDHPFSETFRVKYLDRKDIEELGWTEDAIMFTKGDFSLIYDDTLYIHIYEDFAKEQAIRFYGKIKNYNELKKIMEMLEI